MTTATDTQFSEAVQRIEATHYGYGDYYIRRSDAWLLLTRYRARVKEIRILKRDRNGLEGLSHLWCDLYFKERQERRYLVRRRLHPLARLILRPWTLSESSSS